MYIDNINDVTLLRMNCCHTMTLPNCCNRKQFMGNITHHPPHLIKCPFRNPIQHGSSQRIRTIFQGVRVFLILFEPCLNKIERIGEEMLTLGEYRVDKLSHSFIERTPD